MARLLRRRRGREVPCWPGDRRSASGDQDGISHRDRPSPPRSVLGGVPGAGDVLPAAWRPSALLVHLGTNDFTPGHEMSVASFAAAYVELLLNLTAEADSRRPASKVSPAPVTAAEPPPVFAACGPMGTRGDHRGEYFPCSDIWDALAALGAQRALRIHPLDFRRLYEVDANVGGCNHPSVQGQQRMAEIARPVVERVLGWSESIT
mmetsp:Transcript_14835/g.49261  ORF Transcript_14835/g.49261 Transcript_14835/m.49261 type:complete len:206 (+) Transcript_14835:874-1491(+)